VLSSKVVPPEIFIELGFYVMASSTNEVPIAL